MTIDLATASTYTMPTGTGTVVGIEALGEHTNTIEGYFQSGSGDDTITTLSSFLADYIATNDGADRVRIAGGKDVVLMGAQPVGTVDTLVIDWSAVSDYGFDAVAFNGSLAAGYSGNWSASPDFAERNRVDFTGVERFEISASQQRDIIHSGDGDDIVAGNAGNDDIYSRKGVDIIDGGGGIDLWNADKSMATALQPIVIDLTLSGVQSSYMGTGTVRGIERLELTTGAGNDVVTTLGSFLSDTIATGAGNDIVKIAGGRDNVAMGDGFDTLIVDWSAVGDYGFEVAVFNGTLAAGYSGNWNATPDFGDRNRVDFTGVERFEIKGSQKNDVIQTGDGDDIVLANDGNDFISSRKGADQIDGGAGTSDRWNADKSAATVGMTIDLATASSYTMPTGTGTVVGIEALGEHTNTIEGYFRSGSGDDTITTLSSFLADYIATNDGADRVKISGGRDVVLMGAQPAGTTDTLVIDWSAVGDHGFDAGALNGSLTAGYSGNWSATPDYEYRNRVDFDGVERFEIKASQKADVIRVGDGDDIVEANAGDDLIYSRQGVDIIDGGIGTDLWNADKSAATALQPIVIDLTLSGIQSTYMGTGTVRGIERLELTTGAGDDVVTTLGSFLSDAIVTGAGNDIVKIAGGRDNVAMGDGVDTLIIDWSAVVDYGFDAVAFNGTLAAGYSGNWASSPDFGDRNRVDFSGVERFEIKGSQKGDVIHTGDGDDVVFGNDGNDLIISRKGVDIIDGGAGTDLWNADKSAATAAQAIVIDLTLASIQSTYMGTGTVRGIERLELTTGDGNDRITTLGSFLNDTVVTGAGNDIVKVAGGRDAVTMGAGDDLLIVDYSAVTDYGIDAPALYGSLAAGYSGRWHSSPDFGDRNRIDFDGVERFELRGGALGDYMVTGDGNDSLYGNAGNDTLVAQGGNDLLDGGLGNDTMVGGLGDDSYIVDSLGDVVTENAGEGIDAVETRLAAYTLAANVETLSGTSAIGGQSLTGNALDNVILGSTFGDILDGGAGNDTLYGGEGADFFKMGSGNNNQVFGDGGTDTLVLSGLLSDYAFSTLGDGRVKVVDTRDPTGTIGYLTSIERIEIEGGSITLAQAMAGNIAAKAPGTTGNDTIVLTVPRQVTNLTQGGSDSVTGTTDIDYILFGPTLDPTDQIDAQGGIDQLGLQGNYSMTLGSNILGIDFLAILSGTNTDYGDTGTHRYTYNITTTNATVAGGAEFVVQANALQGDEPLTFDGSAETDGSFFLYAGLGVDTVKGGANNDRFFFGEGGRFTPADAVDGNAGADDQLGLRGDYASTPIVMTATSMVNIETLVLLSGSDLRFGAGAQSYNYNVTTVDANVAAGARLTVNANTLQANETVRFDGSAETNGSFFMILGNGADVVKGGAGADIFFGSGGADVFTGGAGADTYIYRVVGDSLADFRDTITDFATGDRIDLSRIDAIVGGGKDAFTYIGQGAFTGAAGQLRAFGSGTAWTVEADVDGDGYANFAITVTTDHALVVADFIL